MIDSHANNAADEASSWKDSGSTTELPPSMVSGATSALSTGDPEEGICSCGPAPGPGTMLLIQLLPMAATAPRAAAAALMGPVDLRVAVLLVAWVVFPAPLFFEPRGAFLRLSAATSWSAACLAGSRRVSTLACKLRSLASTSSRRLRSPSSSTHIAAPSSSNFCACAKAFWATDCCSVTLACASSFSVTKVDSRCCACSLLRRWAAIVSLSCTRSWSSSTCRAATASASTSPLRSSPLTCAACCWRALASVSVKALSDASFCWRMSATEAPCAATDASS
mmetsp:Transcript_10535/g.22637  ORF Transcript_10535/g.22637 Transcript_10535/m.22637 type:complete len:280 (-) Transcript_10535:3939-4778(-)